MYEVPRTRLEMLGIRACVRIIHMSRFFTLLELCNCSVLMTLVVSMFIVDTVEHTSQRSFILWLMVSCLTLNTLGLLFTWYGFTNTIVHWIYLGRLLRKVTTIPTATLYFIIFDEAVNHEITIACTYISYIVVVFAVFFRLSLLNGVFIHEWVPQINTTSEYKQ